MKRMRRANRLRGKPAPQAGRPAGAGSRSHNNLQVGFGFGDRFQRGRRYAELIFSFFAPKNRFLYGYGHCCVSSADPQTRVRLSIISNRY
jgi:hypothetical protein